MGAPLKHNLRVWVFWPAFLLILVALVAASLDGPHFVKVVSGANTWALGKLSPLFAGGALFFLFACTLAFFSPLGRVVIGGPGAKRFLSPVSWCTISLCTTTAVGILFWGMAEPIYHLTQPPRSLGLVPGSGPAAQFALSSLFLHWSFVPCAIYALPALVFALAFHNLNLPFSLSSCLAPLIGRRVAARFSPAIDSLCLFALVAGMAASLATGVLTLAGGLNYLYGIKSSPTCWILIGVSIVVAFLLSALSGVHRGITWLSNINTLFFFVIAGVVVYYGPIAETWALAVSASSHFVRHFVSSSLFTSFAVDDPWPRSWTVFYWSVWLAWAPVSAAFLGRVGVGYTVRSFLLVNLLIPAVFSYVWMGIFGGTALAMQSLGTLDLAQILSSAGPEMLVYRVFDKFPFASIVIPTFLITAFISYVTAADSNTLSMAGMSSHGISADSHEPPLWLKLVWGGTVGALALFMLCLSGLEGIKTLSYLGGFPALFFVLGTSGSLVSMIINPAKFGLIVPSRTGKRRSLGLNESES